MASAGTPIKVGLEGLPIPVHILDGRKITFQIMPDTTARHLVAAVADALGMPASLQVYFGMYDYHVGNFLYLDDEERLARILEEWTQADLKHGVRRILYRPRLWLPETALQSAVKAASSPSDPAWSLVLADAVHWYIAGMQRYPAATIWQLAACQLQAWVGAAAQSNRDYVRHVIEFIVPGYALQPVCSDEQENAVKYQPHPASGQIPEDLVISAIPGALSLDDAANAVWDQWRALAGWSAFEANNQFLNLARDFVAFGADWFVARRTWKDRSKNETDDVVKKRTEDVVVGIGHEGIHVITASEPLGLQTHLYSAVTKWVVSSDLKVWACAIDDVTIVYVVTPDAAHVEAAVERYVEALVAARSGGKPAHRAPLSTADQSKVPKLITATAAPKPVWAENNGSGIKHPTKKEGAGKLAYTVAKINSAAATEEAEEPAGDEELLPGWEFIVDEDGDQYYFNASTGESSWERPTADPSAAEAAAVDDGGGITDATHVDGRPLAPGWQRVVDDDGDVFYFNEETGESEWEPVYGEAGAADEYAEDERPLAEGWARIEDEDGDVFYFHEESGESVWDPPYAY